MVPPPSPRRQNLLVSWAEWKQLSKELLIPCGLPYLNRVYKKNMLLVFLKD